MPEVKTAIFTVLLAVSAFACGNDTGSEDPLFDDRADVSGFDIVDIEVGESLQALSVEKIGVPVSSATQSELKRSLVLLKLHLSEGESASVVMRAASAGLDSYLIVKNLADGLTVGKNDDQKLVTSLGTLDSLVSLEAGDSRDVLIFASGGFDLHTGGQFGIDVVEHESPGLDLHTYSPGVETLFNVVKSSEEELSGWIALGYVSENLDGFLEKNNESLNALTLRERTELSKSVDKINDQRTELIDILIDRSGSAIATRASVGQALAAIYQVSRNSQ